MVTLSLERQLTAARREKVDGGVAPCRNSSQFRIKAPFPTPNGSDFTRCSTAVSRLKGFPPDNGLTVGITDFI